MSDSGIDKTLNVAAGDAVSSAADPGEGQGLTDSRMHPGGTQPGGGADSGDAPLPRDLQRPGGAAVGSGGSDEDTEGARFVQDRTPDVAADLALARQDADTEQV